MLHQEAQLGLATLVTELKRRRVFRALIGYGIAAFAVLQIIEPIMHGLHWPDATLSYVVVGLAAGFPLVVALAWVFDIRAGSIERTAPAQGKWSNARVVLLVGAVGALAAAPGLVWNFLLRPARSASDHSIAVLPLASMGDENGYFAQGIHDELLRQLASIRDLQVISRTSVLQYRERSVGLREIGEALGVASILEGSVQRVGNRVRIEAKLFDARTDRQLWAERYDRDATDVLAIETLVAEEIVRALHAKLLPEQKEKLERRSTRSPEAHDLYLRGLDYFNRPGWTRENLEIAAQLFRKATEVDPAFALAHAQLATTLLNRVWWHQDAEPAVAEAARAEAERSLQLQPDLAEGHLAMGYYHYYGHRDFAPAMKEFEVAQGGIPNEANAAIAFILRRLGRLEEAASRLEVAARLDPRSAIPLELARTEFYLRRYDQASRQLDRLLELAPDMLVAVALQAAVQAAWKGETRPLEDALHKMRGKEGEAAIGAGLVFLLDLAPREALAFAESLQADALVGQTGTYPKAFLRAEARAALGEHALAERDYIEALPALETVVSKRPDSGYAHAMLARALCGLGRKDDALREAGRAVEVMPVSRDALSGAHVALNRARVEARCGGIDAAIAQLQELLAIPGTVSPPLLRIDPGWLPLRGDPRFRKLAAL
jgi:serine/threonine-protein kinase